MLYINRYTGVYIQRCRQQYTHYLFIYIYIYIYVCIICVCIYIYIHTLYIYIYIHMKTQFYFMISPWASLYHSTEAPALCGRGLKPAALLRVPPAPRSLSFPRWATTGEFPRSQARWPNYSKHYEYVLLCLHIDIYCVYIQVYQWGYFMMYNQLVIQNQSILCFNSQLGQNCRVKHTKRCGNRIVFLRTSSTNGDFPYRTVFSHQGAIATEGNPQILSIEYVGY